MNDESINNETNEEIVGEAIINDDDMIGNETINSDDNPSIETEPETIEDERPISRNSSEPTTAITPIAFGGLTKNDYFNITDRDISILAHIAARANIGVTCIEDAMMVMMRCRDLALPFAAAVNHFYVLRGKVGMDVHAMKAILSRPNSNITWEKIKDYEPDYLYYDGIVFYDGKNDLPDDAVIIPRLKGNEDLIKKYAEEGKRAVAKVMTPIDPTDRSKGFKYKPIDYITSYKFTRVYTNADGTTRTKEVISTFSRRAAAKAGLIKPNGGHSKYPELMTDHRAWVFGARDIADDLLLGAMEITEMLDAENVDYTIDDEKVIVRDRDGNVIN